VTGILRNIPVKGAIVSALLIGNAGLMALEVPNWWPYEQAIKPQWRIEGEKLSSSYDKSAEGELILARYYGIQGDLPREILHLNRFFGTGSSDKIFLCLAWHEKASVLRQLGRKGEREDAILNYGRYYNHDLAIRAGLESPKVMEAWRLIDAGDLKGASSLVAEISESQDARTEDSTLAAAGLLASEIEGRAHRDPKYARDALLKLMDPSQLGPEKFLQDSGLQVAAVVSEERLFNPDGALGLIQAASQTRKVISPVIPEAEIARNQILLCQWDEAATSLSKAQKILLTYPPGIRAEAGKNLDFAVADYYLASGHPGEALSLLERLKGDFLRPGFTTEKEDYYLAGHSLRIVMATDRELNLQLAAIQHAPLKSVCKALPGVISLFWERESSLIHFRQSLAACMLNADKGRDIGTLIYAPPWLLPEMRRVLGKETFNGLYVEFRPEGRRRDVLESLLQAGATPKNMPPLLKGLAEAFKTGADSVSTAWTITRSAPLLAAKALPVSGLPGNCPASGWLKNSPKGLTVQSIQSAPESLRIDVSDRAGKIQLFTKWPPNVAGRIEVLNRLLLNADQGWNSTRKLSIEGKDLDPSAQLAP
jgi:hypothetical protein